MTVLWRWHEEREMKRREYLCFECETKDCALNDAGLCCYPLVHGKKPVITEEDGCTEMATF